MSDLKYVMFTSPRQNSSVIRLDYDGEDILRLELDPDKADFYRSGADLVVQGSSGDMVFIDGFFHGSKSVLPDFVLKDGVTLSASEFFSTHAPELDIAPALSGPVVESAVFDSGVGASVLNVNAAGLAGRPEQGNTGELMQPADQLEIAPGGQAAQSSGTSSLLTVPEDFSSPVFEYAPEFAFSGVDGRSGILLTDDERMFLCKTPEASEFNGMEFQAVGEYSPEMLHSLFAADTQDLTALFPERAPHTASGGTLPAGDLLAGGPEAQPLLTPEEYLLLLGHA
ncbi:hypothetical protein LJC48_00095 [Desulfovibrio sp. OttesenSCG-928-C06]|nr:hypothetical protein [Desulfovibrio sp. OttesenSCG-928-C06]